jgi:ribonuclease HI
MCNRNKVMLLWVHHHSAVQGNKDADALARKGSSNPLLGSGQAIPISSNAGRLKNK